jgi:acyl-homoserine-lactone acylase
MIAAAGIDPLLTDNRHTPRGRRSLRQLEAADALTLDGLDRLRASSTMDAAERARRPLAAAAMASDDADLRRLGAILGGWDGSTTPESRGSVLFADWAYRMERADLDLTHVPIDTISPLATEATLADVARALGELRASGAQIERLFGSADVAWGQVYRIRYAGLDLPSPVGRDELGAFNAGHYQRISEAGPDEGRFILTHASHFIGEVAFGPDGPEARGLLTYGNHDDPEAPDVRRQLEMFSRSEVRAMHFHPKDVNEASIRREILDISDDKAPLGSGQAAE